MADELKPHERIWLEEVRTCLASGKPIDYPEMMVELRDKLPTGFTPIQIDPEYLQGSQLTVAGIHALDPNAPELKDLERLLRKIREWIIQDPHKRQVSAEEYATAVGVSKPYAARLLALAGTLGTFWASAGRAPDYHDDTGFSSVNISSLDALATLLAFTSIEKSLHDRTRARQSSDPQNSWRSATLPPLPEFTSDPDGGMNTPFSAAEQVQVKRAIEEFRVYITSTYTLDHEPLATFNRKLDYLIDASTRFGRKDWIILCIGLVMTLASPQLTPSGPSVQELFGIAWHLVRQLLGHVISPPLLH